MQQHKSEFACPACEAMTGAHYQIYADSNRLVCPVNPAHSWGDTQSFMSLNPKMVFKVEMPKPLPQENFTPLTVSVPIWLAEQIKAKYGEKLSPTIASLMRELLEGESLVVSAVDRARIKEKLGQDPRNSSELYGMIFAMMAGVDEAKNERDEAVRDLKAYEGMSAGRVVVDLGANYQTALAKAKDAEQPLKYWVETQVKNMIDNNWV